MIIQDVICRPGEEKMVNATEDRQQADPVGLFATASEETVV
jgi:hypothetical protein